MRTKQLLIIAPLAAALAACGSGNPAPSPTSDGSNNSAAKEVAAKAGGDLQCPPTIHTPPRVAEAPVDDIAGVRPGLAYEEALNLVRCSDPQLRISSPDGSDFYGIKSPHVDIRYGFHTELTSNDLNVNAEHSNWTVRTVGMSGLEKVISVRRKQAFAEGHYPTTASLEQSLLAKYGTPTWNEKSHSGSIALRWAYDSSGRRITENSPFHQQCNALNAGARPRLSPDCGVVVEASVDPLASNRALAQGVDVRLIDEALGNKLLTATKQRLQAMDAARRAKEVKDATQNAQAPQL